MPEFHLDTGLDADRWEQLDEFTKGYVEGMFFTSEEELGECGFHDLAQSTLDEIKAECVSFEADAHTSLEAAYERGDYTARRAGVDFWLTRNHHGAGFWDRGLGDIGDALTETAHIFGEADAYVGDDGKVYIQ